MRRDEEWDNAKFYQWEKFWQSSMGKEAMAKFEALKRENLDFCMRESLAGRTDTVLAAVSRAAGIDIIIEDIRAGIAIAKERRKEDEDKKDT
jgi:hypothetical protein